MGYLDQINWILGRKGATGMTGIRDIRVKKLVITGYKILS